MSRNIQAWFRLHAVGLAVAAVCVMAFAVRTAYRYEGNGNLYYGSSDTGVPKSDARAFSLHALSLIAGRGCGMYMKGFKSFSYVPPGHPFFIGMLYFYFGNQPLIAGWVIAILSSLVPLFLYLATREMMGRGVAVVGALLVALYPPYVNLGFTLMTEPMAIVTTALAIWLWTRLVLRRRVLDAILAGMAFGYSALVRPSALAFALASVPWLLAWSPQRGWRRRIGVCLLFVAALYTLPAAWGIRTWIVHGKPGMSYSSIGTRHAWTGANPEYGPDFYSRRAQHDTLWSDPHSSEIDRVLRLRRETKEFIRKDRVRYYLGGVWRALRLRDSKAHRLLKEGGAGVGKTTRAILATLWLWMLAPLGLLRVVRIRTLHEDEDSTRVEAPGWIWAGAFGSAMVFAIAGACVYGASDRYRWPLELLLFPFAAVAIVSLAKLGTVDIAGIWRIVVPTRSPTRVGRLAVRVVVAGFAIVVAIYCSALLYRYVVPSGRVASAPLVSEETVWDRLASTGLEEEFRAQEPRWISYDDVFEDQVRHNGTLIDLRGRLVVWWGRVVYPRYDADGRLLDADFEVNASDSDIGGTSMIIHCGSARTDGPTPREDDIVTVIARLQFFDRPKTVPDLEVHWVLPGKFALPPAAAPASP